jgi:hypothetical protein
LQRVCSWAKAVVEKPVNKAAAINKLRKSVILILFSSIDSVLAQINAEPNRASDPAGLTEVLEER